MSATPAFQRLQHRTTAAGVEIHSVEWRPEPDKAAAAFVLVHGLGMSSRYMMPTAAALAASGTVHALDLPGFGKSGKPRRTLSIPALADTLAAWLEARQIEAPVLIGNSLGAQVVADCAARYPGRLRAAVLLAPTVDPGARSVSAQVIRLARDMPREPVRLYWIGLTDYLRAGWSAILETLHLALAHPITETLRTIRIPVLLVSGGRDPIMPQAWHQEAAGLISIGKDVVFSDAAHAVNFSHPHQLAGEVLQFLETVRLASLPNGEVPVRFPEDLPSSGIAEI